MLPLRLRVAIVDDHAEAVAARARRLNEILAGSFGEVDRSTAASTLGFGGRKNAESKTGDTDRGPPDVPRHIICISRTNGADSRFSHTPGHPSLAQLLGARSLLPAILDGLDVPNAGSGACASGHRVRERNDAGGGQYLVIR